MFTRLSLLIGKQGIETLANKRVLIFGLGGVGGHCCDALVRSGITHFGIVDSDVVSLSNLNRQIIATRDTIGQKKVDVMETHLKSINPDVEVIKYDCFYLPENAGMIDFSSYDYVIDAIDTVVAKIDIIVRCFELDIPLISAMGCGNRLDPSKLIVTDIYKTANDPLAKVLRHELRNRGIKKLKVVCSSEPPLPHLETLVEDGSGKRNPPGSSAFVPASAGLLIASEVIKELLN